MNEDKIDKAEQLLKTDLEIYATIHDSIKGKVLAAIKRYTLADDEVVLKSNGVTGWLGELYAALHYGGKIIPENESYDILTGDDCRLEVKTRRGVGANWRLAGTITDREESSPTHLVFVKLNSTYELEAIYEFEWTEEFKKQYLVADGIDENTGRRRRRFKFRLKEEFERTHRVYPM